MQGYEKEDDGIYWGMADTIIIKDSYTQADRDEKKRIRESEPVENGEIVMIDGAEYRARVLGDFSNCVVFDKVVFVSFDRGNILIDKSYIDNILKQLKFKDFKFYNELKSLLII